MEIRKNLTYCLFGGGGGEVILNNYLTFTMFAIIFCKTKVTIFITCIFRCNQLQTFDCLFSALNNIQCLLESLKSAISQHSRILSAKGGGVGVWFLLVVGLLNDPKQVKTFMNSPYAFITIISCLCTLNRISGRP